MNSFPQQTIPQLLQAFQRAASGTEGYRTLLEESGVEAGQISDLESFLRLCPFLDRTNTFNRFSLEQLCVGGRLGDLAGVLTSSGHGSKGRFSFGLIDRRQAALGDAFIDQVLDDAFQVKTQKTLAINCLPMGVVFSSGCMTVATTSVREDMAVALVQAFGKHYDQILLVGDPLFMKRLTDHARERDLDWGRYKVKAILGEEIFGEHYRGYLASCLGADEEGGILGSFGVAELGLHICYETPATVSLRRAAFRNPRLAGELFGIDPSREPLPMVYSFDPGRVFIEAAGSGAAGYGAMAVSMLDAGLPLPLIRYKTGDVVRLLDRAEVAEAAERNGTGMPANLPACLLALKGREKERLPNGSHVGFYKDALYADREIARHLTGAFRLIFSDGACEMHLQQTKDAPPGSSPAIHQYFPGGVPGAQKLAVWPYGNFPFGMGLDYERKFTYFAPPEQDAP